MQPVWKLIVIVACVLTLGLVACGKDETSNSGERDVQTEFDTGGEHSDDVSSTPDGGAQDVASGEDVVSQEDTSGGGDSDAAATDADTTEEPDVVEDVTPDLGTDAAGDAESGDDVGEDDVGEDAGEDAGQVVDPYEGRPLGQCTQNAECPEGPQGRICSRSFPGGTCMACSSSSGCPADTSCSDFGTCVMDCSSNDDCAPGLRCHGGTSRCAAMPCADGACPVPLFGCSASNLCERKSCASQGECPEQTTCISGLCIEDRALNL